MTSIGDNVIAARRVRRKKQGDIKTFLTVLYDFIRNAFCVNFLPLKPKVPVFYIFLFLLAMLAGNVVADCLKKEVRHQAHGRQIAAAALMQRAQKAIRSAQRGRGAAPASDVDINETGMIGVDWSPITTTTGNLEAKRTSANPAFAALMVRLFSEAGLTDKDVVAIGASGSFPALCLATLCAARVLRLEPLLIYSIGSSSYGANDPEFTFLQMLSVLNQENILPYSPIAVSFGGEQDHGLGLFSDETPPEFERIAKASGAALIHENTLSGSIRQRMMRYTEKAAGRPIRCFVNIGGASANFGATPASLTIPNGLIRPNKRYRSANGDGLVYVFLKQKAPVIHLLDIRHLALSYDLPIDPVPIPAIGNGGVYYETTRSRGWMLFFISIGVVILVRGRLNGAHKKNLKSPRLTNQLKTF